MTKNLQTRTGNPLRFLLHVPVPWVFVVIYLAGLGLERAFPLGIHKENLAGATPVGAGIFVAGAIIAGWGWWIFHRARTTTVPGQKSSALVTWGPYRFTRNPMYVGLTLAYLGEAGILKQIWPVVFLPLVVAYVNFIVIPVEEAKLKEVFQEEYEQYRMKVRRWV